MNIETLANVLLLVTVAVVSGAWYKLCKLHADTKKLQEESDKLECGVRDLLRMHFDAERARVVPSEDSAAARKSWEALTAENDSLHRKLDMSEREKSVLIAQNKTLREGCSKIAAAIGNGSAVSPDASVQFLTQDLAHEIKGYCASLRSEAKRLQAEVERMKAGHA